MPGRPAFAAYRVLALGGILLAGCGVGDVYSPYNRGIDFQRAGDLTEAIRQFKAALEDRPDHLHALFNLAVCYKINDLRPHSGMSVRAGENRIALDKKLGIEWDVFFGLTKKDHARLFSLKCKQLDDFFPQISFFRITLRF